MNASNFDIRDHAPEAWLADILALVRAGNPTLHREIESGRNDVSEVFEAGWFGNVRWYGWGPHQEPSVVAECLLSMN